MRRGYQRPPRQANFFTSARARARFAREACNLTESAGPGTAEVDVYSNQDAAWVGAFRVVVFRVVVFRGSLGPRGLV